MTTTTSSEGDPRPPGFVSDDGADDGGAGRMENMGLGSMMESLSITAAFAEGQQRRGAGGVRTATGGGSGSSNASNRPPALTASTLSTFEFDAAEDGRHRNNNIAAFPASPSAASAPQPQPLSHLQGQQQGMPHLDPPHHLTSAYHPHYPQIGARSEQVPRSIGNATTDSGGSLGSLAASPLIFDASPSSAAAEGPGSGSTVDSNCFTPSSSRRNLSVISSGGVGGRLPPPPPSLDVGDATKYNNGNSISSKPYNLGNLDESATGGGGGTHKTDASSRSSVESYMYSIAPRPFGQQPGPNNPPTAAAASGGGGGGMSGFGYEYNKYGHGYNLAAAIASDGDGGSRNINNTNIHNRGGGSSGSTGTGTATDANVDDGRSISSAGSSIRFTGSFEHQHQQQQEQQQHQEQQHHEDGLRGLEALMTVRDRAQTAPHVQGFGGAGGPGPGGFLAPAPATTTVSSSSAKPHIPPEEFHHGGGLLADTGRTHHHHRRNWSTGQGEMIVDGGVVDLGSGRGRASSSTTLLTSSSSDGGTGTTTGRSSNAGKFIGRPPLATSKTNLFDAGMTSSSSGAQANTATGGGGGQSGENSHNNDYDHEYAAGGGGGNGGFRDFPRAKLRHVKSDLTATDRQRDDAPQEYPSPHGMGPSPVPLQEHSRERGQSLLFSYKGRSGAATGTAEVVKNHATQNRHHTQSYSSPGPYLTEDRPVHGGDAYMPRRQPQMVPSHDGYYARHARSYSHGNIPNHSHHQAHDGHRGDCSLAHQKAQDFPPGGRQRFATSDGIVDPHVEQHHCEVGGLTERQCLDTAQHVGSQHGIPRSASVGTNFIVASGNHGEDMPMRRSESVPGYVMPLSASTYHEEESIHHGGDKVIDAYGNRHQRPDEDRDRRDRGRDFHGHPHGQPRLVPPRGYDIGSIEPVAAPPKRIGYDGHEEIRSHGSQSGCSSQSPRQQGLERSRSDSLGRVRENQYRHGAVPPSHNFHSSSYDPDYIAPLMGERILNLSHGQVMHQNTHGQIIDHYDEPIVLPRYGIATMPRPPSSALPGNGPKVVYNIKFKRMQRCFILGPRVPHDIEVGAYVKVEADRGEDLGIVASTVPAEEFNESCTRIHHLPTAGACTIDSPGPGVRCAAELKRITRLATQDEIALLAPKSEEENELLKICRSKVQQRGLPMHVVDAEYQFDRHKLTFFFEAECRIDFRELVRDLFSIYKTRIWMQQLDNSSPVGDKLAG